MYNILKREIGQKQVENSSENETINKVVMTKKMTEFHTDVSKIEPWWFNASSILRE